MQNLSSGRFIVGVIQSHQRVSEERGKLSARLKDLVCRSRLANDLREIGLHFQIGVTVVINSRAPFFPLTLLEDRLRHLELTQFTCQRRQVSR